LDQAQHEVSCTPRPRVSPIRPHQSIFHPSSALSILLQSLCHLYILSFGHYGATIIEKKYGNSFEKGVTVRLLHPEMFGPLGQLFKTNLISKDEKRTIFGKKVFKPNHITNVVFILSCFQNTMITLVNHIGAPYSGSILESRSFCLWTGLSILFCVATATEAFKPLNEFLELAPMPSKLSKIFLLALIAFDGVISIVVDKLCVYLFDNERWKLMTNPKRVRTTKDHAADEEDLWLANERKANQSLSFLFGLGIIFLLIQHVVV
jgi:magnesium-transporting ATPase (P-type)